MDFITNFVNKILTDWKPNQVKNFKKEKKSLNWVENKKNQLSEKERWFVNKEEKKLSLEKHLNESDSQKLIIERKKTTNNLTQKSSINLEETDKVITKDNHNQKDVDLKNNRIAKELIGYLWNDSNLDASLINMDLQKNLEQDLSQKEEAFTKVSKKKKKWKIEFKSSKEKGWKLIAFQFFVWVILIAISFYYIKDNTAEKKFFQSSIDLWTNIFQSIASQLWWFIKEDVDKSYIKKRWIMINELITLEKDIQVCIDKTNDDEKLKELRQLLQKVDNYKKQLSDIHVISLEKFIKRYDEYNLRLYSLQESKQKICKK